MVAEHRDEYTPEWAIVTKGRRERHGTKAQTVLKTLTTATSKSEAAPGMIKGSENLQGPTTDLVTGLVSAIEIGVIQQPASTGGRRSPACREL
jgi:hypothetical protein